MSVDDDQKIHFAKVDEYFGRRFDLELYPDKDSGILAESYASSFNSSVIGMFEYRLQNQLSEMYYFFTMGLQNQTGDAVASIPDACTIEFKDIAISFIKTEPIPYHGSGHAAAVTNKNTGHMIALLGEVGKQNFLGHGIYDCKLYDGPLLPQAGLEPYYNVARIIHLLDVELEKQAALEHGERAELWGKAIVMTDREHVNVVGGRHVEEARNALEAAPDFPALNCWE